ncbi:MAG: hypothetical protein AAB474_01770 [Patescibacteria group bacterium]
MFAVINLKSSGIDGAVSARNPQGLIEIKKISKSGNLALPEPNLDSLWRKMKNEIKFLIAELLSKKNISKAVVIFSSPWYFSEIRRVFEQRPDPIFFSKTFIDELLAKETENFRKSAFAGLNLKKDEATVLDARILQARLNGYPVKDPEKNIIGKKARTLELVLHLSAVFGEAEREIKNILNERGVGEIMIENSSYVLYKVLNQIGQDNIMVLNIDGEITELAAVKDGEFLDAISFGRGLNFMARRLGTALNLDINEALSVLENYINNKLEASSAQNIKNSLKPALSDWEKLFAEALRHLSIRGRLPEKLLIVGPGAALSEFGQAAAGEIFKEYTIFGRPFSVFSGQPPEIKSLFANIGSVLSQPELTALNLFLTYENYQ